MNIKFAEANYLNTPGLCIWRRFCRKWISLYHRKLRRWRYGSLRAIIEEDNGVLTTNGDLNAIRVFESMDEYHPHDCWYL